jgi:hypothetical protein
MHSWILYFFSSLVVACRYNNINVNFVVTMVCNLKIEIMNIEDSNLEIDRFEWLYVYKPIPISTKDMR